MKTYVAFKVKTIRENGVSVNVRYDLVRNLTEDEACNMDRFPNGQQLEDDGVAFFWSFKVDRD